MTKYEQFKHDRAIEKQEDKETVTRVLNNTFINWELDNTTFNHVVIRGLLIGNRKVKSYVIVNRNLLEIKDNTKIYNYSINGASGKNTKNISVLDELPFYGNSTTAIKDLMIGA